MSARVVGGGAMKKSNEYARSLGEFYALAPKAVIAAAYASRMSCGGDRLEEVRREFAAEWCALYDAGVVTQRPPSAARLAAQALDDWRRNGSRES